MKKTFSTIALIVMLIMLISMPAYAYKARPVYISLFGMGQKNVNRVWAVSSSGKVKSIQIWDEGTCLKNTDKLKANHYYTVKIRVEKVSVLKDSVGEPLVYTNGISGWSSYGTDYVTAKVLIKTPKYFFPSMFMFWN